MRYTKCKQDWAQKLGRGIDTKYNREWQHVWICTRVWPLGKVVLLLRKSKNVSHNAMCSSGWTNPTSSAWENTSAPFTDKVHSRHIRLLSSQVASLNSLQCQLLSCELFPSTTLIVTSLPINNSTSNKKKRERKRDKSFKRQRDSMITFVPTNHGKTLNYYYFLNCISERHEWMK